ncbi:low-specificity L-threonine aldolase [Geopsychrobacter electrodiphilus]|uniref:low-specificity L-threonine aldolase n=1 Tax=Geopsychrobacter electrodiphilus TaxID=225196 RepID=UPI000375DA3B|nr:low-specificity L-threonine aldolase [Geopsychrobacter electrodiphilus]
MHIIDLRSDTVTLPSELMRETMAAAKVGDDVYGEDPTVNRLQQVAAELVGKEAGLFVPSGTMSNLIALLSHCQRGDEYIVGQQAHTYKYEGGGAAVLGSIQPQPLEFSADGSLDLQLVRKAIKPRDSHFARTRLLCLENTQGGKVLSLGYQEQAAQFARDHQLAFHLDGARVCNAAVAQGVALQQICQYYDTVSICLSKGLGAPVGSVLVGSTGFIAEAHRWRKMCGGGMRQAGILAAAGLFALEHQFERLAEDHANARALAEGLLQIDQLNIDLSQVQSNMVFVDCAADVQVPLIAYLHQQGILVSGYGQLRLVTHLNIDQADITRVIQAFRGFFSQHQA